MRKIVSFEMKKPLLLFLAFLVVSTTGFAQESDCEKNIPELIPYRKGDKWGCYDKNKKVIIKPQFDEAYLFNVYKQDYGLVNIKNKFFYINKLGKLIAKREDKQDVLAYEICCIYQDNVTHKFGVKKGKTINIPAVYDEIAPVIEAGNESLYLVIKNGKSGYIDCKGKEYFEDQ